MKPETLKPTTMRQAVRSVEARDGQRDHAEGGAMQLVVEELSIKLKRNLNPKP